MTATAAFDAAPQPWRPERSAQRLAVLGKLAEEAGELTGIAARCIIQGIGEAEPVTLKPNRAALEDEIADIIATAELATHYLGLDRAEIAHRAAKKHAFLMAWFDGLAEPGI